MAKYTVKRLLQSLLTVFIIVSIVFVLMRMLPTDYYFTEEQQMKYDEETKHDMLQAAGLLDPIPTQLFRFYRGLLRLDFGESRRIQTGVSVWSIVAGKFTISMRLGLIAMAISLAVGVILGVLQARQKDRLMDHVGTVYTVFVNSVPPLVSYSLVLAFGARILKLPSLGGTPRTNTVYTVPA